jgi:hypothetical protein
MKRGNCPKHSIPLTPSFFRGKLHQYRCLACKREYAKTKRANLRALLGPPALVRKISFAKLSDTQAAYLAGIIDGEGSIILQKGLWRIHISNTCHALIEWLVTLGHHALKRPERSNRFGSTSKPCWQWILCRQGDVAYCLFQVSPYMLIKAELARKALTEITTRYVYVAAFLKGEVQA